MWLFSTYLQRAFHGGLLLPALGFIFLRLTTIVYVRAFTTGKPEFAQQTANHESARTTGAYEIGRAHV